MTHSIDASHSTTEIDRQLREQQLANALQREKARDAQWYKSPQPAAAPPAPPAKPAKISRVKAAAKPPVKTAPAVPPGGMVLDARAAKLFRHLVDTHPDVVKLRTGQQ